MTVIDVRAQTERVLTSVIRHLNLWQGAIAQLGERVLCKHEVVGSNPIGSTSRDICSSVEKTFPRCRVPRSRGARDFLTDISHREEVGSLRESIATQVAIDTQSPSTGANNWLSAQIGLVLCRLLDRTPSERSEASWSF